MGPAVLARRRDCADSGAAPAAIRGLVAGPLGEECVKGQTAPLAELDGAGLTRGLFLT